MLIKKIQWIQAKKKIENLSKFVKSLNHFLNKDMITIIKIKKKGKDFHARFSARMRIYKYIIINRLSRPVIDKNRGWHIINKLDLKIMK